MVCKSLLKVHRLYQKLTLKNCLERHLINKIETTSSIVRHRFFIIFYNHVTFEEVIFFQDFPDKDNKQLLKRRNF